jgi:hypothetical protein
VREGNTGTVGDRNEIIDLRPAVLIKGEAELLGLMPQDEADEFAEAYKLGVHVFLVNWLMRRTIHL